MNSPKIMLQEKVLSVLLALDGDKFCAYCPELDLATEMSIPDECIEDVIDAMRDYAEEYMENFDLYSKSPNRAHHLPYIRAVASCKTDWELRMLIEIKHGVVHV